MKTLQKLSIALVLLFSVSLFAQSGANGLQDLVGAKGSSAENELENRGFVHIKTSKSNYDVYSYWWNNRERKCVSYHLTDGRIKSIVNSMPYDCNKNTNGSGIHSSHSYNSYNENYSHKKYNSDNFNNSYRTRDSKEYNGHAEVHDLMKISAPLAYERLQDRGFVNVKTVKGQDKLYKIWYNNETNQCIKTVSLHKHIHDILKSTHCH
ncbi:MAG: hypothetical protein J7K34_07590 [Flavobacteriaceae bacterium]|nr:hypothetical protein [Flavobacteriaceae bacterium]